MNVSDASFDSEQVESDEDGCYVRGKENEIGDEGGNGVEWCGRDGIGYCETECDA